MSGIAPVLIGNSIAEDWEIEEVALSRRRLHVWRFRFDVVLSTGFALNLVLNKEVEVFWGVLRFWMCLIGLVLCSVAHRGWKCVSDRSLRRRSVRCLVVRFRCAVFACFVSRCVE